MKKYNVYGMGNALVDMVFEVTNDFINAHAIEKGLMTLVDEERQHQLLKDIHIHEDNMQCGGSAANTIISVSQLGGKTYYSCKVANDAVGKFYFRDLLASGVDTNLDNQTMKEGITGKCLVMITPDADRTMNTFLGITASFSRNELNEEALKASEFLYIEGYLVTTPEGQEAMVAAKQMAEKHGVKTALTFSDPNMVRFFKEGLNEVIGSGVDLLFCNEEEALTYAKTDDILIAREKLKKVAKTFVITLGKHGAMIFDGNKFLDIAPYKVDAIDTNGAGDSYAGAFLYGITHGYNYEQSGDLASLASSKVVSKIGPRLDWHQVKEVLNHVSQG